MDKAGHKKLIVWQKADELAYQIYLATRNFPKEEIYGITSQLRRAALSVPTNIVEGYGRQSKKATKIKEEDIQKEDRIICLSYNCPIS